MIQMIGRGLRTVDPTLHHGIVKTDCIVLDFGISSLTHGTLEQDVNLDKKETAGKEPEKEYPEYPECPECLAIVPRGTQECPTCGYVWQENATQGKTSFPLTQFKMSEIDLLRRTSFQWVDLFNDDSCLIATGFHSWSGVFCYNKTWYAIGGIKGEKAQLLSINKRVVCLAAADDWLNQHETDETAHKSKQWLQKPPTEKQLYYIHDRFKSLFPMTRYYASNLITFQFNKNFIQRIILANTTKR